MSEKVITARFDKPDSHLLASYVADGGYQALRRALGLEPAEIIEVVKASGLRGRGGAGFPAGVKWSFVPRDAEKPVYLCINADEGEPGTFKDRAIMERDPHALIEGGIIAARAIGAQLAFIYVRGEFRRPIDRLNQALAEARQQGFLGHNILGSGFDLEMWVHSGAGSYVCGEETALIESIEGHRGMPRLRPPFPAQEGLFGGPTVVNNVETLANVPHIINRSAAWFASLGCANDSGTKLFGVSGHVKRPGLYELPMGTPLREIIFDHCGGIREGHELKAVIPGGVSTPMLTPDDIDVNMDYDSLAKAGSMLGSGAIIVMDETTCIPRLAAILAKFYAHESCGQCSPCRVGTREMLAILERICSGQGRAGDLEQLEEIGQVMQKTSLCGLGQAAPNQVLTSIKHFRHEYEQHITQKHCSAAAYQDKQNGDRFLRCALED